MKRFVEATPEASPCLTEPSLRGINDWICRRKHRSMWRSMTNAKDLPQTFTNQGELSTLYPTLGHLLNGAWTSWAFSLRHQGIRDICWSIQITSPSGLKLNHWQISGTWMPRDLFGRTLSLGSGSFISSSRTMAFSLIARLSGDTIMTMGLQIDIPTRLIHKGMDKQRLSIRS